MHCYIIKQDTFDGSVTVAVAGTLDEVRSFVKQHPVSMRKAMFVELRDIPTDKGALLFMLSDLLAHTHMCPENPGTLLRSWSVTPRGALKEDTDE